MSINYQELVPEKALGKEISRHILQTYRTKTGLPHEIGLLLRTSPTARARAATPPPPPPQVVTTAHPTKSESLQEYFLQQFAFLLGQETRSPYYSWTI